MIAVKTNVSSLNGQRYLTNANNALNTTYQRLSSGLRINSAKDDAAGLQIADRLTSQINGLNQGSRNANDGLALVQTIEGAMDEITNMLQKGRTLTVQYLNGTNTQEDREALSQELYSLQEEIHRIATQTTYGGRTVLNGRDGNDIYVDDADSLPPVAGGGGNIQGGKMVLQVGANSGDTIEFDVAAINWTILSSEVLGNTTGLGINANAGGGFVDFANTANFDASVALEDFDTLIQFVDEQRSNLGAIANRLESTIRNAQNVAVNEADARSRIQDADFAEESANLSQQSIIQQAAASMLMQANMRPQLGLSLIG